MAYQYEVLVTELRVYRVPVDTDGDWDEQAIGEKAKETLLRAFDRDRWLMATDVRVAEYRGVA